MATKAKTTPKSTPSAAPATNGGIVFQKLGKDFTIPTVSKKSHWEETLSKLNTEAKGEVVAVYSVDYEKARKAYTKNKQLRQLAEKLGYKEFNSVVRKQVTDLTSGEQLKVPQAVIFAGISVAAAEAEE